MGAHRCTKGAYHLTKSCVTQGPNDWKKQMLLPSKKKQPEGNKEV